MESMEKLMIDDDVIANIKSNTPFYKSDCLRDIFSLKEFENLVNLRPFISNNRFIVATANQNEYRWNREAWLSDVNTWPSSLLSDVLKNECIYICDCSKVNRKVNDVCKFFEKYFKWPTDAHIFFSNTINVKKSLGKHFDESHNLIVQIEGESSLKVWSKNDDLVIDEIMKPNDVVFVPKGTNHHVIGLTKRLSISFPMNISSKAYPPQDRTWIELI